MSDRFAKVFARILKLDFAALTSKRVFIKLFRQAVTSIGLVGKR